MNPEYIPVLIIVAFVVYPFVIIGIAAFVVSLSGRERFPIPAAKRFGLAGCIPPVWFIFTYGFGKIPPVTVIGSAVFVFGAAATGGLLGAIVELFVPRPLDAVKPLAIIEVANDNSDVDDNPYAPPTAKSS